MHSVSDCAIINKSPGDSDRQKKIRVWRSLVSRLNGVQEALSSNLNTRTIKDLKSLRFQVFLQMEFFIGTKGIVLRPKTNLEAALLIKHSAVPHSSQKLNGNRESSLRILTK